VDGEGGMAGVDGAWGRGHSLCGWGVREGLPCFDGMVRRWSYGSARTVTPGGGEGRRDGRALTRAWT